MSLLKKTALALSLASSLFAKDIVVYNNEYNILDLQKGVKKLIIGNKDTINVALLSKSSSSSAQLKIFGKKAGNTSMLVMYKDGSVENYSIYVNENLGFIQKMINIIEPNIELSRVGDGSTVMRGHFENPHDKKRVLALLESADINTSRVMDLTQTKTVEKMVRTKLYLVEINNQRAEDLGGVTGLGFFNKYVNATLNSDAANGATFSGWLLDNTGQFSADTGNSVASTLNFLETNGIGKILDDTVLMTTEDKNASFRVGGEVYIPIGVTQNVGFAPTIRVEEREYGLDLTLKSKFMEKDGFIHIDVTIEDSDFDTDTTHNVKLGNDIEVPSFVSKNIQTNIVAASGQVIVLGGRLHTENVETQEKVPFLGDIPLLGELFKHKVSLAQNNDLLFFLVPEIVDANSDLNETHYYKPFKEESRIFHEEMQKSPPKKSEQERLQPQQLAIITPQSTQKSDEDDVEIELEPSFEVESETPDVSQLQTQPQSKSEEAQEYAVVSKKIFLRDAPLRGKKAAIWGEGHRFVASEEKSVDGSVWLKIAQDCLHECSEPSEELWIAKKYVKAL